MNISLTDYVMDKHTLRGGNVIKMRKDAFKNKLFKIKFIDAIDGEDWIKERDLMLIAKGENKR